MRRLEFYIDDQIQEVKEFGKNTILEGSFSDFRDACFYLDREAGTGIQGIEVSEAVFNLIDDAYGVKREE